MRKPRDLRGLVSIHASAREATLLPLSLDALLRCFNPRLRAGGDTNPVGYCSRYCAFQSTPPRGRRQMALDLDNRRLQFQSTPPRGRRRWVWSCVLAAERFNPRLRAGGDLSMLASSLSLPGFQSTPPRGRRHQDLEAELPVSTVSIHASAREATPAERQDIDPLVFQSTPPRGRRLCNRRYSGVCGWRFNPRLRAGGDSSTRGLQGSPRCFNPRLRAGGDAGGTSGY